VEVSMPLLTFRWIGPFQVPVIFDYTWEFLVNQQVFLGYKGKSWEMMGNHVGSSCQGLCVGVPLLTFVYIQK